VGNNQERGETGAAEAGDNQKGGDTGATKGAEGGEGARRREWCRCKNITLLRTGGTEKSRGADEYLGQPTIPTSEPHLADDTSLAQSEFA